MIGTWSKAELSKWFAIFYRGMNGVYTRADYERFIADITKVKRDWERVQLMLDGYLLPARNERGDRHLIATEEGLASSRRADVERAGSWLELEIERVAAAPAKAKPWKPESGFPLFEALDHFGSAPSLAVQ